MLRKFRVSSKAFILADGRGKKGSELSFDTDYDSVHSLPQLPRRRGSSIRVRFIMFLAEGTRVKQSPIPFPILLRDLILKAVPVAAGGDHGCSTSSHFAWLR